MGTNVTSFFRIRAKTTGKVGGKDLRQLTCFGESYLHGACTNLQQAVLADYVDSVVPEMYDDPSHS